MNYRGWLKNIVREVVRTVIADEFVHDYRITNLRDAGFLKRRMWQNRSGWALDFQFLEGSDNLVGSLWFDEKLRLTAMSLTSPIRRTNSFVLRNGQLRYYPEKM